MSLKGGFLGHQTGIENIQDREEKKKKPICRIYMTDK